MAHFLNDQIGERSLRRFLTYGIFLMCVYAAWMRGGTYLSFQWPLIVIALLLSGIVLVGSGEHRQRIRTRLIHDPAFYAVAVFVLLLLLQRFNSGYRVLYGSDGEAVLAGVPSSWMPWSVDANAGEMLNWFVPV